MEAKENQFTANGRSVIRSGFASTLQDLISHISARNSWPSSQDGFALWITYPEPRFLSEAEVRGMIEKITEYSERFSEGPILASAGYLLHSQEQSVPGEVRKNWMDGVNKLKDKDPFRTDRQSFLFRPEELLGICLGATALEEDIRDGINWLRDAVSEAEKEYRGEEEWRYRLGEIGAAYLGIEWSRSKRPSIDKIGWDAQALHLLSEIGRLPLNSDFQKEELVRSQLLNLLEKEYTIESNARASAVLKSGMWCLESLIDEIVETYYDEERQARKRELERRRRRDKMQASNARNFGNKLGVWAKWGVNLLALPIIAYFFSAGASEQFSNVIPEWVPPVAIFVMAIWVGIETWQSSEVLTQIGRKAENLVIWLWERYVLGQAG